jgi:hypothetical protein
MSTESPASECLRMSMDGRYLVVVARDQKDLWQYLKQNISVLEGVEVVLDRRQGGRWQWTQSHDLQAQRKDRRGVSKEGPDLPCRSFVIVPRWQGAYSS